jgi:hypothetical protein
VGFREQINKKPALAGGMFGAAILVLVIFMLWQLSGDRSTATVKVKMYYSSDDGHTWFADDGDKIPPFDHGGAPAVRCYVFQCGASQPFAGYLEKYTPEMHDQLAGLARSKGPMIPESGALVKKPGGKDWVLELGPLGRKIVDVHCPDGSADQPQPVLP